jgi:hypothetical protein
MFLDRKRQDSSFSPLRHQTKYNKKGHVTANLNCLDMTFSKVYKELYYQIFTRFSGAIYIGLSGVILKASYQA